ncbi:MAG TPA: DUF1080 domain-containing protein [Abditibacteriaceae bacterium]|jgi:hypothetical protein
MKSKHKLFGLFGVGVVSAVWSFSSLCNAQTLPLDEEGFRPLFTSKGMAAWGWNKKGPKIENGEMLLGQGSGDIWTTEEFGDFILDLEFKTSPGSNSGVFIRNPKPGDWYGGIEIQVLDSFGNQNPGKHDVASVYDVLAPSKNTVKAPGEWNRMTITCKGPSLKVALNGEQVIDMNLDLWTEAGKNPDGSANKFKTAYKDMPRKGVIELQDHGQDITFRNVRIKELKD